MGVTMGSAALATGMLQEITWVLHGITSPVRETSSLRGGEVSANAMTNPFSPGKFGSGSRQKYLSNGSGSVQLKFIA
jgi:hypothetical protein